jgi:hypothetical protein
MVNKLSPIEGNTAAGNSRQWNGKFLTTFQPIHRILRFFGESDEPWIEWKTWNRDGERLSRRYQGNASQDNAMQISGDYHDDFGIYAPGVWRHRRPQGGVQIPWDIEGAWYVDDMQPSWGYDDINEEQPERRDMQELDEMTALDFPCIFTDEVALCSSCVQIPLKRLMHSPGEKYEIANSLFGKKEEVGSCVLCSLMFSRIEKGGINAAEISIYIQPGRQSTNGMVCLAAPELCVDLGMKVMGGENVLGFPILPEAGSPFHFELINEWLRICDHTHSHPISYSAQLPTRVVDVGDSSNRFKIRLHISQKGEQGLYVALSHQWGSNTFRTTRDNLNAYREGIVFDELPKTFQDAVIVARSLGIRYLWVDSLCIIQDDDDDWRYESMRMEKIFHAAYVTVAAASATNTSDGFLHRCSSKTVKLQNSKLPRQYAYIVDCTADFTGDVENGPLSQRAWVLQERALSRRTIHFSAAQTYWECGECIRCETFYHEIRPTSLLSSSVYPITLDQPVSDDGTALIEELFVRYSSLSLTCRTDRPTAIVGLESRLAKFYRTPSVYGIITKCLGRSLLWTRSGDAPMESIPFEAGNVPSWSWMAYRGPIDYLCNRMPASMLTWRDNFRLETPGNFKSIDKFQFVIAAPLARFRSGSHIEPNEYTTTCKVKDGHSRIVGEVTFDCTDYIDVEGLRYVVIAELLGDGRFSGDAVSTPKLTNLVLVVRESSRGMDGGREIYCRVGIGVIHEEGMHFSGPVSII